ncbi:CPBP family intramembrane metalloprotease [Nocardiopsis sp. CNT-189]|uniref:CPBP family intramembrane glutamic endopeptidase n=1 Tax=Nocardiopsis oceanisediminis TaxID=2816862 RepID=UPI003B2959F8
MTPSRPTPRETAHAPSSTDAAPPARVLWRPVLFFCTTAYALGWLAMAPAWAGGGIEDPRYPWLLMGMQAAPSAAVLAAAAVWRTGGLARSTGLAPVRPLGRTVGYCLLGLVLFPAVSAAAVPVAAAADVLPIDPGLSGLRAAVPGGDRAPASSLVLLSLASGALYTLVALPFCLGEEWGWRGFLLPRLLPLGTVPAVLACGLVWGLWHTPMVLLGHLYGRPGLTGIAAMTALCVLAGALLSWLRLRSGTVWPAAVGHASLNHLALTVGLLPAAAEPRTDPLDAAATGWPGWAVMAALIAAGAGAAALRRARTPARRP